MRAFIDPDVFDREREGSYESVVENRAEAVKEKLGSDAVLVATFEDRSVYATPSAGFVVSFSPEGDVTSFDKKDIVVTEGRLDSYMGESLRAVVTAMIEGSDVPRNRLRHVVKSVEPRSYWFADFAAPMDEHLSSEPEWLTVYIDNRQMIRKSLHGAVASTEARVPSSRYGKLGEAKLVDFQAELEESVDFMLHLLMETVGRISSLEVVSDSSYEFDNVVVAKQIADDARSMLECGKAVRRLARGSDLGHVAQIHDSLADRLRDMVIIEEYLVRSAPAPQSTERKNAAQS